MRQLTEQELLDIKGGLGMGAIAAIIGGIVFFIGALDGFVRPIKCNKKGAK